MKKLTKAIISWMLIASICLSGVNVTYAKTDYSKYSAKVCGWGLSRNTDHKTPTGSYPYSGFKLSKYNACYVGDTSSKVVYLTFDCGYENGNTKAILDTLKKNKIKAIFFVTKYFVDSQPDLVKRMKKEGHLVGNHTANHINLGKASPEKIKEELTAVEKAVKKKTGYTIDKFVRPPEGGYSERALKVMQDMGYSTIFWSAAWMDWDVNNQPSVDFVVGQIKTYHHKGMIPLIHNTSSADTKALPGIIKVLKDNGYTFKSVDEIFKKTPSVKTKLSSERYTGEKIVLEIKTKSKGKQTIKYYQNNKKVKAPVNAGKYYAIIKIKSTKKYKEVKKKINFSIKKAKPEIKIALSEKIEKGQQYEPTIETSCVVKSIELIYYSSLGEVIDKPVEAGEYFVSAHVKATSNYYKASSKKISFIIY